MSKKQQEIKVVEKKRHRGLKIFAIIMTVIIVFPIAFVFIAFYDTTTKKVSDSEVTYQNIVSKAVAKGFDALSDKTNPRLELYISPDMFDGIMMSACDSINQKKWIPKMYCYVKDNNYTFVMDAQASFFKTRLLLHAKLGKVEKGDSSLIFKITGLTIGRLPIPTSWIAGIAGNFIKEDTINNAFAKAGFNIKCNLKKLQLTYTREQFRIDVANYLNSKEMGGNNKFLNVLLSTFDNDEVLETNYKNGVTVDFKLKKLMLPTDDKPAPLNFADLDSHKEEVTYLLNEKGLPEDGAGKIFTYFIRGYKKSSNEIKGYIDNIMNEEEKSDLEAELDRYVKEIDNGKGITDYEGSEIEGDKFERFDSENQGYCLETMNEGQIINYSTSEPYYVEFQLPSNELNRVLACKLDSVLGMTIPVTFKDSGTWSFEYITVDNVYTGFKQGDDNINFNIYLRLNIDGCPVTLTITTDNIGFEAASSEETNVLGHLKFELDNIHFGSIDITSLSDDVVSLIPESGEVFKYNKEAGQFEVSIDKLIPDGTIPTDVIAFIKQFLSTGVQPTPSLDPDPSADTFYLTYGSKP